MAVRRVKRVEKDARTLELEHHNSVLDLANGITSHASKSDVSELVEESCVQTPIFLKTFFPDIFNANFNSLHKQIFDLIDARNADVTPKHKKIVIAAPRGLGKTSIISYGVVAKRILMRDTRFVMYISNSLDVAKEQTENIKQEMLGNEDVRSVFGSIKTKAMTDLGLEFSKESWIATLPGETVGTRVVPRGCQQQVRGRVRGKHRPDLIVIDDLLNAEEIDNEDTRKKVKKWFYGSLMKCVSAYDKNWQVVYIDTLKHEDDLLSELLESPEWIGIRLSAATEIGEGQFVTNDDGYMSQADLEAEVREYRNAGMMGVFYQERMCQSVGLEVAQFKKEFFRHYEEGEVELDGNPAVRNVVIVDPAKSGTAGGNHAHTAIVGVGFDQEKNLIYVRDVDLGAYAPDDMAHRALDMGLRLNATAIGIEETGLQEFAKYPFNAVMDSRGDRFPLIWLKARASSAMGRGQGKAQRVGAMAPFYRQGKILHNKRCCNDLESQLLSFPKSKRWDAMDALSYFIEMFDLGGWSFKDESKKTARERVASIYADSWGKKEWDDLLAAEGPPLKVRWVI